MDEALLDPAAWEVLQSMTGPAFLDELIDVYLADSPALIAQARGGLAAGDAESVRRAAHSLKSNSASFGAARLAEAARALEGIARGGALEDAPQALARVEAEYALVAPLIAGRKHAA